MFQDTCATGQQGATAFLYKWFPVFVPLPAMKEEPSMTTVSEITSSVQTELERLVGDLRSLLSNKDLDGIPEIKQLRQRLDEGIHSVRDSAVSAAQDAAAQAKEAAAAADRYAHDEPWRVASGALVVGALVGFLLARR